MSGGFASSLTLEADYGFRPGLLRQFQATRPSRMSPGQQLFLGCAFVPRTQADFPKRFALLSQLWQERIFSENRAYLGSRCRVAEGARDLQRGCGVARSWIGCLGSCLPESGACLVAARWCVHCVSLLNVLGPIHFGTFLQLRTGRCKLKCYQNCHGFLQKEEAPHPAEMLNVNSAWVRAALRVTRAGRARQVAFAVCPVKKGTSNQSTLRMWSPF